MNNFKQYHRPDDGDTPQPKFRRRAGVTNHQKQKQQESTPSSARKEISQRLAYNKTTYNDTGLLMKREEKLNLRNRSGYCTECEGPPTLLYNVKKSGLDPLWFTKEEKEPRTVAGECAGGICFICHPSLQPRNCGGDSSIDHRNQNLTHQYITNHGLKKKFHDYWLSKIKKDWRQLGHAPERTRGDKEIVIAAIEQDVEAFRYVSPQIRKHDDISRLLCARWLADIKSCKRKLENAPTCICNNKKIVLAAVQNDGNELRFASPDLRNDKEVAIAAIKQDFEAICYASPQLQQDEDICYASPQLQQDEDILSEHWIIKITKNWRLLKGAPMNIRDNKKLVLAAIKQDVFAYEYASPQLQEDKDVLDIFYNQWLVRVKCGCSLIFAPERIRNDKRIVVAAIKIIGVVEAVKYASPQLQQDKDITYSVYQYWLSKVQTDWRQLEYAPDFSRLTYRNDLISAAFQQNIQALEFVSVNDKEAVLEAIQQNPWSFEFVPDCLRKDKDVVLAAMKIDVGILKFVHEDIKRDRDVLVAAGMFDEDHVAAAIAASSAVETKSIKKIALSTRFSLHSSSHSDATNFTKLFKGHPYIDAGDFKIYAPNAFDKKTCDPDWTNYDHPCRGTKDTCQFDDSLKTGHPTDDCCWRYSFRYQLNKARMTGGFMLQLVEREVWGSKDPQSLGNGQRIEQEMANDLGVKIFQVYRPITSLGFEFPFDVDDIEEIVIPAIRGWYDGGCGDMSEYILRPTR